MELKCVIATKMNGDPMITITKDCPRITIDIYTEDINLLKSLVDKELSLNCDK